MAQKQEIIRTIGPDGKEVLSNLSNQFTGGVSRYKQVDTYIDGTPMEDSKLDLYRTIYIKKYGKYFKMVSDKDIDLEAIGVKYNDPSSASKNLIICAIAINLGYNIVIKDKLYLSGTTQDIVANSISIRGEGENAEIIGSGLLFNLPDVLTTYSITNIKITAQGGVFGIIKEGEFQYQSVIHKNLTIEGDFTFRLHGTNAVNSHVNYIEFSNCVIRNTNTTVFITTDVTYDKFIVNNNTLREIGNRFISDGISNEFSNKDLIKLGKKLLIISNNILINSNETFLTEALSEYLLFALTEAYESHYFNNHVEGLKSVVNVALYDIYQSSEISYYYNNVWKNNMCFVFNGSSYGTKVLYKGKGSREAYVYNNTWIIEKSFLEKFITDHPEYSLELEDCFVGYQSFDTTNDSNVNFYFKNNIIDVYYLNNLSTANQRINKYEIEGNSITCEILYYYFMTARYGYKTGNRRYTFKNNTINVLGDSGTATWGIIASSTPNNQIEGEFVDLDFSGNIINTNSNLTAIVSNLNNLTVSNNKIICNNRVFLSNDSTIQGVFTGENNTITTNNSASAIFYSKLQVIGTMSFKCNLFTNDAIKNETDGIALTDRGVNYVLSQRVILSCPDFGETDVTVYIRRKIVGGDHYVEYIDNDGVLRERKIEAGMTIPTSIWKLYQFKDQYTGSDIAYLRVNVRYNEPVIQLVITEGNNNYTIKSEYNVQ